MQASYERRIVAIGLSRLSRFSGKASRLGWSFPFRCFRERLGCSMLQLLWLPSCTEILRNTSESRQSRIAFHNGSTDTTAGLSILLRRARFGLCLRWWYYLHHRKGRVAAQALRVWCQSSLSPFADGGAAVFKFFLTEAGKDAIILMVREIARLPASKEGQPFRLVFSVLSLMLSPQATLRQTPWPTLRASHDLAQHVRRG
jgi:hypothetical protein